MIRRTLTGVLALIGRYEIELVDHGDEREIRIAQVEGFELHRERTSLPLSQCVRRYICGAGEGGLGLFPSPSA
ncbi:hypothetical protein [Azospirillum sp. SYSU D00513]|uniref:hypothetical protein n=1 Tax=Azospirillum sp. SYSU D00513 TaxID=2812561 RepID=UPI001A976B7D|nr:hypothetical protein [Azospirillum sp. SYSU D00513]